MKFTIEDIKQYARGGCDATRANQIREYLISNPDLIIYVVMEKRRIAMERLHITDDKTIPGILGTHVANAIPTTTRRSLLDNLMSIFGKKNKKNQQINVTETTTVSIGSENNKEINKNSNDMKTTDNISITPQQLNDLRNKASEIKANADATRSTLHNMVTALLAANPELSADKAAQISRKLIAGVTNFNDVYAELGKAGEENVNETIYNSMIARMEGMTPEQQANVMINFMALVRTIDARNISTELSTDDAQIVADFDKFVADAKSITGAIITPEILEQLRQQLKATIEDNTLSLTGVDATEQMIAAVAADERGSIEDIISDQLADADTKAYIALAAYIAAMGGEIGLSDDVDPTLLGTSIAAGIERQQIINKAAKGIISWENAAKLIKLVGAALMLGTFIWFAADLFLLITGAGVVLTAGLINSAIPVVIMGGVIGAFFGYKTVKWLYNNVASPIAEVMSETYDKVVNYILSGELKAKVKETFASFVNFLKGIWLKIKETVMPTTANTNAEVVTE